MKWPDSAARSAARASFNGALIEYWIRLNGSAIAQGDAAQDAAIAEGCRDSAPVDQAAATPGESGEVGADVGGADLLELWKATVQNAAPEQVRSNLWLTFAWAKWCIKAEEPRLYWLAIGFLTFLGMGWAYQLIRGAVELIAAG